MFAWAQDNRVVWHFIAPGEPMRMASARVSTGACATSFSTRACSSASIMPGPRSRTGRRYNQRGRTRRWAISTGGLCRQSLRNTRCLATPTSPPIACCSTRATRLKTRRGSNRLRMKVQWQVSRRRIGRRWCCSCNSSGREEALDRVATRTPTSAWNGASIADDVRAIAPHRDASWVA